MMETARRPPGAGRDAIRRLYAPLGPAQDVEAWRYALYTRGATPSRPAARTRFATGLAVGAAKTIAAYAS